MGENFDSRPPSCDNHGRFAHGFDACTQAFLGEGGEIDTSGHKAGLIEQGISKLRRFWLAKARKSYVSRQVARRKGECLRCAVCCAVCFRCPFLADNTCKIYDKRFEQCRMFPIDAKDVDLIKRMGGKCGFTFEDNGK